MKFSFVLKLLLLVIACVIIWMNLKHLTYPTSYQTVDLKIGSDQSSAAKRILEIYKADEKQSLN